MRRSTSIALSATLGIIVGLGAVPLVEPRLPTSPTVVGLRVGGETLPMRFGARAALVQRSRAIEARRVVLRHGERRFETTLGNLGISIDVERTLAAAAAVGHTGSVVRRLRETSRARRGEIDVAPLYRFDEAVARGYVERFADAVKRAPVDAELDLGNHRKTPDVPGRALDVEATVAEIAAAFRHQDEISLIARRVPAAISLADLEDIDVDRVLSRFDTKFAPSKRGRSENVALAAGLLDGLILRPHDTASFNRRVGPRTAERGFQRAPEIVGDELSEGIGGGTCQVSSTLHAAVLYGGLGVLERRSHSRPSDYTALGLDATVSYPSVDLEFQNAYPFTIIVHAFIAEPGTLRIELLGGEAVASVDYKYGVSQIEEYVRRITTKSWLEPGRALRKQKGTRGMDVHSYVTIVFKDGHVEHRQYYSGYRPTPEVFWVSPSYDESLLPPLPEHAKGVEGRLAEDGSDVYPTTG